MHPILFSLGSLQVRAYGVLAIVMCAACGLYAYRYREEMGLSRQAVLDLMLAIVCGGLVGGRLGAAYFYTEGSTWLDALRDSGFSSFHGAWGALAGLLGYCWAAGVSPRRLLDYFGVATPLGHAFGRLGCFLSGCCYGRPTTLPWGVRFPANGRISAELVGVPVHPTQLYEIAADLLIAGGLHLALRRRAAAGRPADGTLFPWYVIAYGVARFSLEPLRGDDPGRWASLLTTAQLMSVAQVLAAGAWLAWARNKIVTVHNV